MPHSHRGHAWLRGVPTLAFAALFVAACQPNAAPATGPSTPPQGSTTPGPTSAVITPVTGTVSCEVTSYEDRQDGANLIMLEHFRCTYAMSDDRLTGTMDADLTTTFEPASSPTGRWEGTVTISNDGGTWTGPARGAVVMWADRNGAPTNYGEGTYVGHGDYSGLVFHENVRASDTSGIVTGYIQRKG